MGNEGARTGIGAKKYHTIRCITHQAIMWRKGKRIALGKNPQLRNGGFYSNTILRIAWFVNAGAHKKSKREKLERNHGENRRKQERKSCPHAEKGEGCRAAVTGKAGQKSGRAKAERQQKRPPVPGGPRLSKKYKNVCHGGPDAAGVTPAGSIFRCSLPRRPRHRRIRPDLHRPAGAFRRWNGRRKYAGSVPPCRSSPGCGTWDR